MRTVGIDLTCLGTSDAFGSAGRHNAGYLLETPSTRLLIDSGPGVLSALRAQGRDPNEVEGVVISHLHGDHFAGLPFLLLDYTWQSRRTRPLTVVGPPGTGDRVQRLYEVMYTESGKEKLPFPIEFVELKDGDAHEVADTRIEAFFVPHQDTELSLGHRFLSQGRSVVYSGDTPWTEDLIRHSSGADLFLLECSTFETPIPKHIRYAELERHRTRLECTDLLLIHLGTEMRERADEIGLAMADDGLRRQIA